jgi:hypothetical protein
MGMLSSLFGRKNLESSALIGCWQLVKAEGQPYEPAEADFRGDGRLFYSVLSGERWRIMRLQYRIEGDTLVTDQPSSPREERSRFVLEPDGTLTMEFGGIKSVFRRGEKKAPKV